MPQAPRQPSPQANTPSQMPSPTDEFGNAVNQPDQSLPGSGDPNRPDNALPTDPARPDQSLPSDPARPDQGLPTPPTEANDPGYGMDTDEDRHDRQRQRQDERQDERQSDRQEDRQGDREARKADREADREEERNKLIQQDADRADPDKGWAYTTKARQEEQKATEKANAEAQKEAEAAAKKANDKAEKDAKEAAKANANAS